MVDRSFYEKKIPLSSKLKKFSFELDIKNHYLSNKNKERLGEIRPTPWQMLTLFFFSFGAYFFIWYKTAIKECSIHLDHPIAYLKAKSWWKIVIPFYHSIMIYKLANLILEMEVQNQYQKTSPILAFFLSVVPPFSMIYLQSSLNTHWKIHGIYAKEKCLLTKITTASY